jgi:hypothetical protein
MKAMQISGVLSYTSMMRRNLFLIPKSVFSEERKSGHDTSLILLNKELLRDQ